MAGGDTAVRLMHATIGQHRRAASRFPVAAKASVLVIAGSDSSGGAGLGRDIETITTLGGAVRPVVTAVTAQSNSAVTATEQMPPALVTAQLQAALAEGPAGAIKVGMLGRAETVHALVELLLSAPRMPLVLDPVLASSSGCTLLDDAGRTVMRQRLFPFVDLLTPNLPEAAALCGLPQATTAVEIEYQARALLALGPRYVLIKGGHADGPEAVDRLFGADGTFHRFASPYVPTTLRGTGCMLASAIATALARGRSPVLACHSAKAFVFERLMEAS